MTEFNLNGILPPLTTPFDGKGEVDFGALSENVARYNGTGLVGYVTLGSNGEAVHLTASERDRVFETVKRAAESRGARPGPRHTVVAGVNELSTRAAIESSRRAADAGADAVLVITPYFYKNAMTQDGLARHFTEVADRCPAPVLLYNVPQNTGVVLEPVTIKSLSEHQNIIGIKDSAGNMGAMSNTIRLTGAGFAVLSGNGSILYPSLIMGATGAVLAVACAAPRACVDLHEAVRAGDHARARELQNRLAAVSHIVTAGLGVAGLKAAMHMAGYIGGWPRGPLASVTDSERARIKEVMRESGLFASLE